ncbi:gag-Pol polyprotein [Trichonephila clavipes]|nr:gag-Pol polyprotein [Trichonephila clavipes]
MASDRVNVEAMRYLAVGKSWSSLLDGQRRAQLSALPRVEGVACFRIITGHDYLQAHLFKIGLADSQLCPLCKSVPMTGEHLSDCPALLHILSQNNCGVLPPARTTSALYWTERRLMSERTLAGCMLRAYGTEGTVRSGTYPKVVLRIGATTYALLMDCVMAQDS